MDKNKEQKKDKKQNKKTMLSVIVLLVLLIILSVGIIYIANKSKKNEENELAYTDLIQEMSYGNVEEIEMTVGSTSIKVKLKGEEEEKNTIIPSTDAFIQLVHDEKAKGNEIKLTEKPRSAISQIPSLIISFLPTAIMLALFILIFKMQG